MKYNLVPSSDLFWHPSFAPALTDFTTTIPHVAHHHAHGWPKLSAAAAFSAANAILGSPIPSSAAAMVPSSAAFTTVVPEASSLTMIQMHNTLKGFDGTKEGSFVYLPPAEGFERTMQVTEDPIQCINSKVVALKANAGMTEARVWPVSNSLHRTTHNEEFFVLINMFLGKGRPKLNGFYLEMGAFDGIQESNTNMFERCLGWKGLLIEASPRTWKSTIKNRPYNHRMHAAPSCLEPGTVSFTDSGFSSATQFSDQNNNIAKVVVHCCPMSSVFRGLGIKHIDFFSLDVEGAELAVLETIDFDEVRIDVLIAESFNRDCGDICPKRDKVRKLMEAKGYHMKYNLVPSSDLFWHPSFAPALTDFTTTIPHVAHHHAHGWPELSAAAAFSAANAILGFPTRPSKAGPPPSSFSSSMKRSKPGVYCQKNNEQVIQKFIPDEEDSELDAVTALQECEMFCEKTSACGACSISCYPPHCDWHAIPSCGSEIHFLGCIVGDISRKNNTGSA
jgi:FkbM family methyltransferase